MTRSFLNFKNRIRFLSSMLLIVGVLFIFRLFDLQIVNATDTLQGFRQENVEGKRGNIFDINGKLVRSLIKDIWIVGVIVLDGMVNLI